MEHHASTLAAEAARLGASLSGEAASILLAHLRLLSQWNKTHNLVGPGTIDDWLARHTLDSLAAAPLVPPGLGLDVGSGAGFPGIPIALARPDTRMILFEPRQKRAAFLRTAIAGLGIDNATVECRRASPDAVVEVPSFVISRATFPIEEWLEIGAKLLAPGGRLLAFLAGEAWSEEKLATLGGTANLVPTARKDYEIPGQPRRMLVVFDRVAEPPPARKSRAPTGKPA